MLKAIFKFRRDLLMPSFQEREPNHHNRIVESNRLEQMTNTEPFQVACLCLALQESGPIRTQQSD